MLSFQSFVTGFALADISGEDWRVILWHVTVLLKVTWFRKWIMHLLASSLREREGEGLVNVPVNNADFHVHPGLDNKCWRLLCLQITLQFQTVLSEVIKMP